MSMRSSRRTPAVGHDYSQGFGPALDRPGGTPGAYQRTPQRFGPQPGVPVGPVGAITRFYGKYAQFSGRASRSEYWWIVLYSFGVALALSALSTVIGTSPTGEPSAFGLLVALVALAFGLVNLVPGLAVTVRRLHDADLSGWFYFLGLVPFAGGLILLVLTLLPSKPAGARFDR